MTPTAKLYTAAWPAALAAEPAVQVVRISLGKPKWIDPERAAAYPAIDSLMPHGLLDLSWPEFEVRYRQLLDLRAPQIEWAVTNLLDQQGRPDRPLLLCCFEKDRCTCHRGLFAAWWGRQTGEAIPEWGGAKPTQMTMTEEDPSTGDPITLLPPNRADQAVRDHVETAHFYDEETGDFYRPPEPPRVHDPEGDADSDVGE
jgi:hypothetical protein